MELPTSMGAISARRAEITSRSPSWINRCTTWIDERPGPAWCYYLAIVLVVAGAQLAITVWEGSFHPTAIGFAVVLSGSSVYYLAMIHYLDKVAARAFTTFRPHMSVSEQMGAELRSDLTQLPARNVRLVTLAGIASISGFIWVQVRANT